MIWGDPSRPRDVRTRVFTAENPEGAPGGGGWATHGTGVSASTAVGPGWKVSPSIDIAPGEEVTILRTAGPGRITRIWLTCDTIHWRSLVWRAHWDGSADPAIQLPVADAFCVGWSEYVPVDSALVTVAPNGGMTTYWPMPFRDSAEMVLVNTGTRAARVYYEIDVEVGDQRESMYLHARWSRSRRVEHGMHDILPAVEADGSYVGTYLAIAPTSDGWWGEGEVAFFIDADGDHPTVLGTGTEDYVGGAWNFDVPGRGYAAFSSLYSGLPQASAPVGPYRATWRFGLYRWHLPDPVRFRERIAVRLQNLGWGREWEYRLRDDDIASAAWFYARAPSAGPLPAPDPADLWVHLGQGAASAPS